MEEPKRLREVVMHARIVTIAGPPDRLPDESMFRERVLPLLQQQAGFKGVTLLRNRARGKALGISLWESEEAANAAMQVMGPFRQQQAAAMGAEAPPAEDYEVIYHG
jgi:heme-degrading monooxygenase HmoA